jgi:hypothetical protein
VGTIKQSFGRMESEISFLQFVFIYSFILESASLWTVSVQIKTEKEAKSYKEQHLLRQWDI